MPAKKKKRTSGRRRGYKIKDSQFVWKPWAGARCPNIHCKDGRAKVQGRSQRRCYTPTDQKHFAFYEVRCFDCGYIQYTDSNLRPVRPPEGWARNSEGRWISPENQVREQGRRLKMAAKKKKGPKKAKKKTKKTTSKGEGVRQVVYFSADNLAVHKAATKYAAEQEQSLASVVVEALTSYLEL